MARPKKTTTTPVKKRAYKKRKWTEVDHKQAIKNIQLLPRPEWLKEGVTPDVVAVYQHESTHPVTLEPEMSEIDFMSMFIDKFKLFDYNTQTRIFQYLTSRYSHLLPSQNTN